MALSSAMCMYSVLIFDLVFLLAVSDQMPKAFAADIGAVQDVVAQQRPFEQTTDAFNLNGLKT